MKSATVFTILSSLLLAAGCATPEVHEADRGVEGTLRAEVNEKHVHIDVDHGVVKLTGHVRTTADRDRIDSLARNTPGVVAVKDDLQVTLPTPGTFGAYPSVPPNPEVVVPAPPPVAIVTPSPVVVPDYPQLKVLAGTAQDQPQATRIVDHLRAAALHSAGIQDVTITVRNGTVSVQGTVESKADHDALVAAIEDTPGVTTILDKLHVG